MFEEPFAEGDSPVHAFDPRVRLAAVAAFSLTAALLRSPEAAAAALALGVFLAAFARLDARALFGRLAAVNGFIVFLWLFLPFSLPGRELWSAGPFTATAEGVRLALLVTLKSNAIVLVFLALAATCGAATLGQAMYRLRVPEKLSFLFLFTYRFIQTVGEEYARLRTAARLRGFCPRNDAHTYRTLASLLGMILVRSFERAERVHKAMLLRGFDGRFTSLREFVLRRADVVFLCLMLAATAVIACGDAIWRTLYD